MSPFTPDSFEHLLVHRSRFPDAVHREYVAAFASRQIGHELHYATVRQSRQWLSLHEALSPARRDDACVAAYGAAFRAAAARLRGDASSGLVLLGLGCGGGEKDLLLVSHLAGAGTPLTYHPVDASLPLAILSARKVRAAFPDVTVRPVLADVREADDLLARLRPPAPHRTALACFGLIHGFRPRALLPTLARCLEAGDLLLLSANLAPGPDYREGVRAVLPQYDNVPTREWLMTALLDAGVERRDGTIRFRIEEDPEDPGLQRIAADFHVERDVTLRLDREPIAWRSGERVRLLFSYRYTTPLVAGLLAGCGLDLVASFEPPSQEEGVYLCTKA